jgi:hypothetical protein
MASIPGARAALKFWEMWRHVTQSRLRIDRNLIDLCSQNKVVFTETANGVGPKFDGEIAIASAMQVRVLSVVFGNFRYLVEEIHCRHEVPDSPVFSYTLTFMGQKPAIEMIELFFRVRQRAWFDTTFAWFAFLTSQLTGRLNFHRLPLVPRTNTLVAS